MMLVFLLLVSSAAASFDLKNYKYFPVTAKLNVSLTIDRLQVRARAFKKDLDVAFRFSEVVLNLYHTNSYASNVYSQVKQNKLTYNSVCTKNLFPTAGNASVNLEVVSRQISLFQFTGYADQISYLNFQRPTLSFKVEAFQKPQTDMGCDYVPANDTNHEEETFKELKLCSLQGRQCSVWISDDNTDGWLFFGGIFDFAFLKEFGIRVKPSWSIIGTRMLAVVEKGHYLSVRSPTTGSGWIVAKDKPFPYEINDLTLRGGSVVRYRIKEGLLQSRLHVRRLTIDNNVTMVMEFETKNDWTGGDKKFSFILADAQYTDAAKIKFDGLQIALRGQKEGWTIKSHFFHWNSRTYALSVSFVITGPVVTTTTKPGDTTVETTTTTTTTLPPTTTGVPLSCNPKDCGGHGSCKPSPSAPNAAIGVCECDKPYILSGAKGCIDPSQTIVTTIGTENTIAITTKTVETSATVTIAPTVTETIPKAETDGGAAPTTTGTNGVTGDGSNTTNNSALTTLSTVALLACLIGTFA